MDVRSVGILSQINQNRIKSNCKRLHIYGKKTPNISLRKGSRFKWMSFNLDQWWYIWLRAINSQLLADCRSITKSESWKLHRTRSKLKKEVCISSDCNWNVLEKMGWVFTILTIRRDFKVWDLVIVVMEYMPRSHWPMGGVLETYGGLSDVVCVVKLNTTLSKTIGSASKIALLEANLDWIFCCIRLLGKEDVKSSVTVKLRIWTLWLSISRND